MAKSKKIIEQQVAAEILTEFMFCNSMKEVHKVWDAIFERYDLCKDPFTHTPCDVEEYCKNNIKYQKELMFEKYGHCDGLE